MTAPAHRTTIRRVRMRRSAVASAVVVALLAAACGDGDGAADAGGANGSDGAEELAGTLGVDPGECADAGVTTGSWFRMVQPGGTVADGPYVANSDSPCGDPTWTPLSPGDDGGLELGDYQPLPESPFDGDGNATVRAITEPQRWFAVAFGLSTNPVDPQTSTEVPPPSVTHDGAGGLTGDLRAFAAAWNGQHFNQGAPKPDGATPGETALPEGSYDPDTGRYTLDWTSRIVGGPFNDFTGMWHFEGTFTPAG